MSIPLHLDHEYSSA